MSHFSFAFGVGTQSSQGEWLEVFYPHPVLNPNDSLVQAIADVLGSNLITGNHAVTITGQQASQLGKAFAAIDSHEQAKWLIQAADASQPMVITLLEHDTAPTSTPEVYLKLQLLSDGQIQPHGQDLTGIFGLLPNVAWTNEGPIAVADLTQRQMDARLRGEWLHVNAVDKFPRMVDYKVPAGVRIGDASRVRLGAHLASGTTVMHEGFVNFNAGTAGNSMIEGRISAGVMVGKNSDLGGGCSTMGTLSGGGKEIIAVGEDCLIGANAGIGIALGNRCIVEAGLYVTAGTKITVLDAHNQELGTTKGIALSGKDDLLFRRNSQSGRVEVKPNGTAVMLNDALHSNN
ncbi:MAG: 2,3,4,5-tetrahydropyridine-2,6-dicarboxylate N-succinyltransferase [Oceanospirillaceae bacterium]|nr:2,3,4,5-tetrahydropyridine-2,6-dicarboxylate N-succinyltransferase [Oceanospirillaceae bacterium]HCI01869.1 2,3,4,5-tetrahydropyridine-2,6-dicarboxylate N-succinyltransferase [Oceanospirillaceae bacterium]